MASRNTEQRRIVAEALQTLSNHPTVDDVYAYVHESYPTISKATVYRVLDKLADEGLATHVRINNGADHFDHKTTPHHHVRCVVCGRLDDVEMPLPDDVDQQAAALTGYRVTGHALQFDGICPACSKE